MLSAYRREWLEYTGRDSGMTEEMDGKFISIFTIGNTIYWARSQIAKSDHLASPCLSAYPSLHMEQLVYPWADFIKFDI